MHPIRACVRVLLFLLLVCLTCIEASSILGCATVGARSHHMNVLRIGRELVGRGHNFTMLVSSTDAISLDTVGSRGFPGLHVVQFKGPQTELAPGTGRWAASLTRDPKEVGLRLCFPDMGMPVITAKYTCTSVWCCRALGSWYMLINLQQRLYTMITTH